MRLGRILLVVAELCVALSFLEESSALSELSMVTEPSHYCWTDLCQEPVPHGDRKTQRKKNKRCGHCPSLKKRPIRREHVDLTVTCSLNPNPDDNTGHDPHINLDPDPNLNLDPNPNLNLDPNPNLSLDPNPNINLDPNSYLNSDSNPGKNFLVTASFNLLKIKTFRVENLKVTAGYKDKIEESEEVIETIELDAKTFELVDLQADHKYRFCLNITHNDMSPYDESSICHDLEITITTNACNTCPFTIDTVPMPRVILLGPTGVGKSTLGNRLLGNKEGVCNSWGGSPKEFGVGHGALSMTSSVDWMVGHWLGDKNNQLVTILDTPGTGDVQGRDCDHALHLVDYLKELGDINTFLLAYKGTNTRFDISLQEQIKLFETIFGEDFWENVGSEFTYWSHDQANVDKRDKDGYMDEETKHADWNEMYEDLFNVGLEIPSFFVDPVYDEGQCEPEETEKYEIYTDLLWEFINNGTAYKCDQLCNSPSGFYSGEPWLMEETANQAKRIGAKVTITWQIWTHGCEGENSKDYDIFHTGLDAEKQSIYQYKIMKKRQKVKIRDDYLPSSTTIFNEDFGKYFVVRLKIDTVQDEHMGEFMMRTKRGDSKVATLKKVFDGEWESWGKWGECSKECVQTDDPPGFKVRKRTCIEPQNGGIPCQGSNTDEVKCAHRVGDPEDHFRICPIDATWGDWTDYSKCELCHIEGNKKPMQRRTRVCYPERHAGETCQHLSSKAHNDGLPDKGDTRECDGLPICPVNAKLGPWKDWGPACPDCFEGGTVPPQQTKNRACTKAKLSGVLILDAPVRTCEMMELQMTRPCLIKACAVNCEWEQWDEWSRCSKTCGKYPAGTKSAQRWVKTAPLYGGTECTGHRARTVECNKITCPVVRSSSLTAWMYSDSGTGADYNFVCYNPTGAYMVSSVPESRHGAYSFSGSDELLSHPTGYTWLWSDGGSGGNNDGSFWRPRCKSNFVAMGDFCQSGYSEPSLSAMMCVHKDLVEPCPSSSKWVWWDKGSGARHDVTVFKSKDPNAFGMIVRDYHWDTWDGPTGNCFKQIFT